MNTGRIAELTRLPQRLLVVGLVAGIFCGVSLLSFLITRSVEQVLEVGGAGTLSGLLVGVVALQVAGFGTAVVGFLWTRDVDWRAYLRLASVTEWTLFYGAAVGLSLMILTALATGMFHLLDIEAAESSAGVADEPLFYVILFAVSTFVAVPLEELFFRGVIQRRLEETFHSAVAIGVASLCFTAVHTGVSVGTGGEVIALALFFAVSVVLGVSYTVTENLYVPIIGHAIFNGTQILVRALEVLL
jgi:membrane protease YdiL (CAAX protease family)